MAHKIPSIEDGLMRPAENPAAARKEYRDEYYLTATLDRLSTHNLWWVDQVLQTEDRVEIKGWAIVPADRQDKVGFTINNVPVDEMTYPLCSPGLAKVYYFKPNSAMSGFHCIKYNASPNDVQVYNIVDKTTMTPLPGYFSIHSEDQRADDLPVPDNQNLARVGTASAEQYRTAGFALFMRLEAALQKYQGKTCGDLQRILDWGCGCGRVVRYFKRYGGVEVHGADIDPVNVAWCRDHLQFGDFHHLQLNPPSDLPADYFDLVYGISVLTHLREHDQEAWLAELSRISRKGALVLLSVHGNDGVAFRNELFDLGKLLRWQEKGFIDIGVDGAVNDAISDKQFYSTSFQTDWYIRKQWGKYFQVLDIVPSYVGHFQDLVVLQKV